MTTPGPRRLRRSLLAAAGVLLVLLVVGVLALDRVLSLSAQKQAARLSAELGRPIAIEGVATRLWGGLGVKVTGLSIGPGPGEGAPLVEVKRAEVSVALLPALLSFGKEIGVREALVHGLRLNVEKLAGGDTNLERLLGQLSKAGGGEGSPARPSPGGASKGKAARPLSLEVGRAALEDARIAFLDRTVPGAKELYVDHLDAEVRNLSVGRPLELVVKAAVLSEQQNLELRLRTAPLPASLRPTPEQVTLKVEPIDLTPLSPFLPKSLGFMGGRFQADLTATLGAAVPGGKGPTRILGGFKATQFAFAGQGGGKRLDATLQADLDADASKGDLDLRRLSLVVGSAELTGHGRVTGLFGGSPRVEGLYLTSQGLDLAQLAEYYPPLRAQLGGAVIAGPFLLSLHGEGTEASQRLELKVDLSPVQLEVPHELVKAAGAPLTLLATVEAAQGGGRLGLDAVLDLAGVDLRPGGSLAKKPGDRLSVKLTGTVERKGSAMKVALTRLALDLLGDLLTGKGELSLEGDGKGRTTRFDAELSGDRLDLDRLLLPAAEGSGGPRPAPGAGAKAAPDPGLKAAPDLGSKAAPGGKDVFVGLSGEARLELGLVRAKGVEAREVRAKVKVKEDEVTLEEAQLQAFGGSLDASGTRARLVHPEEPFKVSTRLKGVSAEAAQALFTVHKVISGDLDADLELTGAGATRAALEKSLAGTCKGTLRNGAFHGKDLVAGVVGPLAARLPFSRKLTEGGSTSLGKELPFSIQIADGMARLSKPLSFESGQGKVELGGGARLDGTLDMPATVALSPDVIVRLTGGKVRPSAPVPLAFKLEGPASSPRIEGLSVDAAAKSLGATAATSALGKILGGASGGASGGKAAPEAAKKLEDEAKKKLKGLFGK